MPTTRSQTNGSDLSLLAAREDERHTIESLRQGDEAAFVALIERYQSAMIRVAMIHVDDRATAEDVVQETWLGVLRGIQRFEARSSLKTWIFQILMNRARTRGRRDARTVPFSVLSDDSFESDASAVEPERFLSASHARWPHHWTSFPDPWDDVEERLLAHETRAYIEQAVADLPSQQREVIALRDIEGWTSGDVCNVLGITETNQRVLLHRARSKARRALEDLLREE